MWTFMLLAGLVTLISSSPCPTGGPAGSFLIQLTNSVDPQKVEYLGVKSPANKDRRASQVKDPTKATLFTISPIDNTLQDVNGRIAEQHGNADTYASVFFDTAKKISKHGYSTLNCTQTPVNTPSIVCTNFGGTVNVTSSCSHTHSGIRGFYLGESVPPGCSSVTLSQACPQ